MATLARKNLNTTYLLEIALLVSWIIVFRGCQGCGGMLTALKCAIFWRCGASRWPHKSAAAGSLAVVFLAAPVWSQKLPFQPQADDDTVEAAKGGSIDIPVLANDKLGLGPRDATPRLSIIRPPTCGQAEVSTTTDAQQIRYSDGPSDSASCNGTTRSFVYQVQMPGRLEGPMALVTINIVPPLTAPIPTPTAPTPMPTAPKPQSVCDLQGANFKMVRFEGGRIDKAAISPDLKRYAAWLDDKTLTVEPACIMVSPVTYSEVRRFIDSLRPEQQTQLAAEKVKPPTDDAGPDTQPAGGVSQALAVAYAASLTAWLGRTFSLPSLGELTAAALEANKSTNDPAAQLFGADVGRGRLEWTKEPCPSDTGFWTVGISEQNGKGERFCYSAGAADPTFAFRLIMRLP